MKRSITIPLILLVFWVFLGSFLCSEKICDDSIAFQKPLEEEIVAAPALEKSVGLIIEDGEGFRFETEESIRFNIDSNENIGADASIKRIFDELANYLNTNPQRHLTIRGRYMANENNDNMHPNLGVARADHLKDRMLALGISKSQLSIDAELVDETHFADGVLDRAVDFVFSESSEESLHLAEIESRLLGEPMMVYFQSNRTDIKFSEEQQNDLGDMIFYLENVNDSGLEISGHSDNIGDKETNIILSKKRADFVKDYLVRELELLEIKTTSTGYGPDKPISENNTVSGRGLNRRVEITMK